MSWLTCNSSRRELIERGAPTRDGEPGWQSDGSYLTIEGERLADEVAQLGYLRTVQDWSIRFGLAKAEGVAEVASVGGFVKQYSVVVDPKNFDALDSLGMVCDKEGKYAEAVQWYEKALKVKDDAGVKANVAHAISIEAAAP